MINTMFQTSLGDFYFDAVFKTEHHAQAVITEHPVQTGAAISDHAYIQPDELMIDIGMSDVNGDGNSVKMYKALKDLMLRREPFTVVSRLENYENMLITSMSAPDDYTTMFAFKASLILKQVRVVSVAVVQVQQSVSGSKNPSTESSPGSKQTEKPAQQASAPVEETKASVLKTLAAKTVNDKAAKAVKAKTATPTKTTKATTPVSAKTVLAPYVSPPSIADKIAKATGGKAMVALLN